MRGLLIGLALSLIATTASAEWVLVTEKTNGDKFYADPSTKRRTGAAIRMWVVQDYAKPLVLTDGKAISSSRLYSQYDCDERSRQVLQAMGFDGKLLTGEVLISVNQSAPKEFIAPKTAGEVLLNFACQ